MMRWLRSPFPPPVLMHAGGLPEMAMVGGPILLFVLLRWLGVRKERRQQAEGKADEGDV